MVAAARARARGGRVVLVGDPNQLPAVVFQVGVTLCRVLCRVLC